MSFADLACFGRRSRLCWHKVRLCCPDPDCEMGSWTWEDPRIAASRQAMTDRAGRWATEQVGRRARSVSGVAGELGCDWHTVNDTVIAYGAALVDDPARIADTTALGLDETLFVRRGEWHRQEFVTSIVDDAPIEVKGLGKDFSCHCVQAAAATGVGAAMVLRRMA